MQCYTLTGTQIHKFSIEIFGTQQLTNGRVNITYFEKYDIETQFWNPQIMPIKCVYFHSG